MKRVNSKAFTLVELLVVIAIIGILAGMVMYAISKSWQTAKRANAIRLAGEVAKATDLYKLEYGTTPPSAPESIYTYLCGGGDGTLWDNVKKKAKKSPLNYGADAFDSSNLLLDPWDGTYTYTTTAPTGAPAGLKIYVYTTDPDDSTKLVGNWGNSE